MSSPLVSVIIPVYNGERYVEETIRSVFDQTLQDFEIIILNDGSTDSSAEIIKRLQQEDNRIIYIPKTNSGVSDTRNMGISKASGKYLAFLDADDVWKPGNLEKKIHSLKDSGKKWVFCDHGNIYEEDNTLHADRKVFKPYNIIDNILLWEAHVVPGPCSNIVAERELFDVPITLTLLNFVRSVPGSSGQDILEVILFIPLLIMPYWGVNEYFHFEKSSVLFCLIGITF